MSAGDLLGDLYGAAAQEVPTARVETQLTPPFDVSTQSDPGAPPSFWTAFLRPSVTFLDAGGKVVYQVAPAGVPDPQLAALRLALVAGVLTLALVGFVAAIAFVARRV